MTLVGLVQQHFRSRRLHVLTLTRRLEEEATQLLIRFAHPTEGLRTYDAIQLASLWSIQRHNRSS